MTVTPFPQTELERRLAELDRPTTDDLAELLAECIDRGVSRQFLARAVEQGLFEHEINASGVEKFVRWCRARDFDVSAITSAGGASPDLEIAPDATHFANPDEAAIVPSPEIDEAIARIGQLAFEEGEAVGRAEEAFRQVRDGQACKWFPPAWFHQGAYWEAAFGHHDPVPVIDFYIRSFFAEPAEPPDPVLSTTLAAGDEVLLKRIFEDIAASCGLGSSRDLLQILGCVAGLPCVIGGPLEISHSTIEPFLERSPFNLAGYLLEWCIDEIIALGDEGVDGETGSRFAQRYYLSLLNRVVDCRSIDEEELLEEWSADPDDLGLIVDLSAFEDRSIATGAYSLHELEDRILGDWRHARSASLMRAIYRGRADVFGNIFPFAIEGYEAPVYLLSIAGGHWLADFHNVSHFDENMQKYCYFDTGEVSGKAISHVGRVAEARKRYQTYGAALHEILNDGNAELARAWWSFFLASQGQLFGDLGLGSRETKQAIDQAIQLLPSEGIDKALAVVRETSARAPSELGGRIVLGLLPPRPSSMISAIAHPDVPAFIARKIGHQTWDMLAVETRRDLEEAEALWERSHREIGAGRRDWGGIAMGYCRAFEAEFKARLLPLLDGLAEAQTLPAKDRAKLSLGQLEHVLRSVHASGQFTGPLAARVAGFIALIDNEAKPVFSVRNRAAHADRNEPVEAAEFLNVRAAVYDGKAFEVLVAT